MACCLFNQETASDTPLERLHRIGGNLNASSSNIFQKGSAGQEKLFVEPLNLEEKQ